MRCSGVLVLAALLATTGGCTSTEQGIVATVCAPVEAGFDESARIDVGPLTLVPPPGYRYVARREVHGGIGFVDARDNQLGLRNGFWDARSFRGGAGEAPKPDCEFRVDGIPIQVFHELRGDTLGVNAIIGFPERPPHAMVMQPLADARIRVGDLERAVAFRAFLRSMRRGDPRQLVHDPVTKGDTRLLPQ
jgi:hypothetical protein